MENTGASAVDRSRLYKNRDKDGQELRRRRNDASVELRKACKTDQLMKRRNVATLDSDSDTGGGSYTSPLKEKNTNEFDSSNFDEICRGIRSSDEAVKFHNVSLCRRVLSREKKPPIEDFTKRLIVPDLVRCLQATGSQEAANLVFEAAWALTNIASGESVHTKAVVDAGAVPHFVRLLSCGQDNVVEQCVWALGNIAGDGSHLRDLVIKAGAIPPLVVLIRSCFDKESLLSNATWFLSNLCRNKDPPPPAKAVKLMLPVLADLLMAKCVQVVQDSCWALSYLSDSANELVDELIAYKVLPRLVDLLGHIEATVVTPALRTLGNVVTGTDEQTQLVLEAGLLPRCHKLLCHIKPAIIKETCWALSNVTAGSQSQIQALIDENLLLPLIEVMSKGDFKSQKEAAWACTNLVSGGTETQIGMLVNSGVIPAFCAMLTANDVKVVVMLLESLRRILKVAQNYGQEEQLCLVIEQCGGLDKLEELQEHDNERVYNLAYTLVDEFFSDDADTATAANDDAEAASGFNFKVQGGASGDNKFQF